MVRPEQSCVAKFVEKYILDSRPVADPTLHNQTALSDVSDDEFWEAVSPPRYGIAGRIAQFVAFFLLFGWLRLLVLVVGTIVYVIIEYPALFMIRFFPVGAVRVACFFSACYIRLVCFGVGCYYIKYDGAPPKDTRVMIHNHTSVMDGPSIWMWHRFTVVVYAGMKNVPLFGWNLMSVNSEFVDREHGGGGAAARLKAVAEDPTRWPVVVAPEGKLSNGTMMFRFRTGGFLADVDIQPVAIRYYRLLPFFKHTPAWLTDSVFAWLLDCMGGAGFISVIKFLPVIKAEELRELTPQQRADLVQLRIANHLGVRAVSTSAKTYFDKMGKKD